MTSINYLSIDAIVVYVFLLLTLVVGLWAGRNVKTLEDYALADRSYGTGTLILTLLATWVGGNMVIGYTQRIFEDGIIQAITAFLQIVSILFIAYCITPRIYRFTGCITIGDLMEKFYGKSGRIVTAIATLGYTIGLVSMQVVALGYVYEWLGAGDVKQGMILGALIIILYSSMGGIRSITVTDVIQFVVLIVAIPLLANVVTKEAGGIKHVFSQIPVEKLTVLGHKKASYYWMILILAISPVGLLSPPYIQRLLMAKDQRQARDMYLSGAFFLPLLLVLEMLMGFSSLLIYPSVKSSQIIPNIIGQLVPIGLKGFCVAGLLAVIMSSADSFLGSGGLVVSHNLIKPFFKKIGWSFNDLRAVRVVTLLMGLLSMVTAFNSVSIANVEFYAVIFLGPLVTIPLVAGILGLKTDKDIFVTACIFTVVSVIISSLLLTKTNSYLIFPIALGTNLISFFLAHVIRYKGFRKTDDTPVRFHISINFSGWFDNIRQAVQERIAKYNYGTEYFTFSLFLCFNYMVPFFMYTRNHEITTITIRTIGAVLCTGLLLRNYWPSWLRAYFYLYWYVTLLYCLPFATFLLYLLNGASVEWTVNIALSTMLLIVLVDWVSFILLSIVGVGAALFYYSLLMGLPFHLSYEDAYVLAYTAIFSVLIGLLFARRREQTFDSLLLQNRYLSETQREGRKELASTLTYREGLVKDLNPNEIALFDDLTSDYIQRAIYHITDYLRLEVSSVNLAQLQKVLGTFYRALAPNNPALICRNHTQLTAIEADFVKLKQLLINAIEYVQQYNTQPNPMYVTFEDAQLGHTVAHMPGYTRTLPAIKITISSESTLPPTQPFYRIDPTTASTWVPQQEEEYPLLENARIIDAHYGCLAQRLPDTQVYVLPVNLRIVRGKVMEIVKEPAVAQPDELSHPLAIELEKKLLEKVRPTTIDINLIKKALEIIKRFHGGTRRRSGEPFFTHPMTVALIVLEHSQDQAAVLAALLHDTVEDTSLTLNDIQRMFGKEVAFLVGKATNLEDHKRRINLGDNENITRILNYEDSRSALVKLADRLHNMQTIQHHSLLSKRQSIAEETLTKLVPLAQELGLLDMAQELEQRSRDVLQQMG